MQQTITRGADKMRRAVFYACVVLVTAWITYTVAAVMTSGLAVAVAG